MKKASENMFLFVIISLFVSLEVCTYVYFFDRC